MSSGEFEWRGDSLVAQLGPGGNSPLTWRRAEFSLTHAGDSVPRVYDDQLPPVEGELPETEGYIEWTHAAYGEKRRASFSTYHFGNRIAWGRGGLRVELDSDPFSVRVYRFSELIAELEREGAGPEVTDAERQWWDDRMERTEAGLTGDAFLHRPVIAERKPVIRQAWFDQLDRLWIQRYTSGDVDYSEADVLTPEGDALFTLRWPRDISLRWGAASESTVVGLRKDELGVHTVVKLGFELN